MFRKPLLAFLGVAALSALAFAPLVNPGTVASADGKARAVAAGQSLTPDTVAIDRALAQAENLELIDCVAGMAGPFHCNNVNLLDVVPTAAFGAGHGSDSWGWTDDDGTEYVIVTSGGGTGFFRLLEDGTTEYLGSLDRFERTSPDGILWNDVKVVNDHAYITAEDSGYGVQIVDMNAIAEREGKTYDGSRDVPEAGFLEGFDAHNMVAFEDRGIVATVLSEDEQCGGGIVFFDVVTDPTKPQRLGCFGNGNNGQVKGDTHDAHCVIYEGPDPEFNGAGPDGELGTEDDVPASDICALLNEEGGVYIVDVSAITRDGESDGAQMLTRFEYEDVSYAHQGWFTENQRWLIFGDELDESGALASGANLNTTTYWIDLQDLDVGGEKAKLPTSNFNAELVKEWGNPNTIAIDHNLYPKGNLVFEANYGAGLRVLEFSDDSLAGDPAEAFEEVAYFDTYPGPGPSEFYGAWNTYPYFESGKIVLSDFQSGLLILELAEGVGEDPEA